MKRVRSQYHFGRDHHPFYRLCRSMGYIKVHKTSLVVSSASFVLNGPMLSGRNTKTRFRERRTNKKERSSRDKSGCQQLSGSTHSIIERQNMKNFPLQQVACLTSPQHQSTITPQPNASQTSQLDNQKSEVDPFGTVIHCLPDGDRACHSINKHPDRDRGPVSRFAIDLLFQTDLSTLR